MGKPVGIAFVVAFAKSCTHVFRVPIVRRDDDKRIRIRAFAKPLCHRCPQCQPQRDAEMPAVQPPPHSSRAQVPRFNRTLCRDAKGTERDAWPSIGLRDQLHEQRERERFLFFC